MKKTETLFIGSIILTTVAVAIGSFKYFNNTTVQKDNYQHPDTKYGAFLAAQHAIYINDFDSAAVFADKISDKDITIVNNTVILSQFLSGKMPENVKSLEKEISVPSQLIYDTYLIKNDDWKSVYERHKKDESALSAPLRIWSAVAVGKSNESLKFIDKIKTNDSWKAFVRGQIYAELNEPERAAKQFASVSTDFMNINDYLYITAFYDAHDMTDLADKLRQEFTSRPGGMYMLGSDYRVKWDNFSGYKNQLAFGTIQNISHTQIMMYSDLSVLMLRFAQLAQNNENNDAINYYLGQYFFNSGGDYKKHFDKINNKSPFYPFALMKISEKTGKIKDLEKVVDANPLLVPATNKLIAKHVQAGDKNQALRVIDKALNNQNLTEIGRAFFLKTRANVYFIFNDLDKSQSDIYEASAILPADAGILAIQAKIWAIKKQDLESAYEYAIALVRKNPSDIETWDILGMVVNAKEGSESALEIMERVGQVANTCSSLFEHLGDLYIIKDDYKLAKDSYIRAIGLSDDGMTILPVLEKKLKSIK